LAEFLKDKLLKTVVNTHHHEDHIAANHLLQERYGVEILAHSLATDKINRPATLFPYQEEVWGYPVPSQVKEIGDTVATQHYRFEVIYTPGHDRDHICLFEPDNGWLFSGDLFTGTRPNAVRPMDDVPQIIADLKTVKDLKPKIIFPAPGKVRTNAVPVLEKTIRYLEELGQKVVELHEDGLAAAEIMKHIFNDEAPIAEFTQQQFSSLNLVKSYLRAVNGDANRRN
jgi:glyoxylase-like metal-dependent hydrolase (beta-lactamase superfamily II)